jgi:hypothetical protein
MAGDHHLAIGQTRQTGRIEEDGAGILRAGRLACVGVAQAAGILLDQREAGGLGWS